MQDRSLPLPPWAKRSFGQLAIEDLHFRKTTPSEIKKYILKELGKKKFIKNMMNGKILIDISNADGCLFFEKHKNMTPEDEPYYIPEIDALLSCKYITLFNLIDLQSEYLKQTTTKKIKGDVTQLSKKDGYFHCMNYLFYDKETKYIMPIPPMASKIKQYSRYASYGTNEKQYPSEKETASDSTLISHSWIKCALGRLTINDLYLKKNHDSEFIHTMLPKIGKSRFKNLLLRGDIFVDIADQAGCQFFQIEPGQLPPEEPYTIPGLNVDVRSRYISFLAYIKLQREYFYTSKYKKSRMKPFENLTTISCYIKYVERLYCNKNNGTLLPLPPKETLFNYIAGNTYVYSTKIVSVKKRKQEDFVSSYTSEQNDKKQKTEIIDSHNTLDDNNLNMSFKFNEASFLDELNNDNLDIDNQSFDEFEAFANFNFNTIQDRLNTIFDQGYIQMDNLRNHFNDIPIPVWRAYQPNFYEYLKNKRNLISNESCYQNFYMPDENLLKAIVFPANNPSLSDLLGIHCEHASQPLYLTLQSFFTRKNFVFQQGNFQINTLFSKDYSDYSTFLNLLVLIAEKEHDLSKEKDATLTLSRSQKNT